MLQNDVNDGKYICEVLAEENEDGTNGADKHEKGMNNCEKMLNEGFNRTEEGNPDEKTNDLIFYEECKMWKKERYFGESEVDGCLILVNSSMKLKSLGLRQNDGGNVIKAGHGSHVELNDCEVVPLSETPPFCLTGSCGLFTNISLRSSSTSFMKIFPSLVSSKALEGKYSGKCVVSVCSSHFSSFCVSSAPFLSSPSIPLVSLSHLSFFNISTAASECSSSTTSFYQTSCLMSSCSFSSVCDVYDGGIVPSLNNPFSSLTASNSSFIGCCRTRNVKYEGTSDGKLTPGRQNQTNNGANSFIWCVWNGSKTTKNNTEDFNGTSNGGAIFMYDLQNGTLSVSHCAFNNCFAYRSGGGVLCVKIKIVEIENNTFDLCSAQDWCGGGMSISAISQCVRISGCEFKNCKAVNYGGGLNLDTFNDSGAGCIGEENGGGESAFVFDCSLISCELKNQIGGGMYCRAVSASFKMRSIQFISCKAAIYGGGLDFRPNQKIAPSNNIYCYFFFFHDCRCTNSTPFGHDVYYSDMNNLFSSKNPFHESYTTNSNSNRLCYAYYSGGVKYMYTEKKGWLKEGPKDRFVGENGDDFRSLCGMSEAVPCKTVGFVARVSLMQSSSTITVLSGKHQSEEETINVGEKKINVLGKGKETSVIGTNSLSSSSTTLFSVTSGQLEVGHVGIDHNATRDSSPNVFVVSDGSGSLSLEDVLIFSSVNGEREISASIFVMELSQLRMSDVEIENMKMSQPLFEEPSSAGSTSGESMLANVTIRNVNRTTEGDGVVMAKSVKRGETFVVWNTTIEECECVNGNGGGIKVELLSSASKVLIGDSISHSGGTTSFNQCKCGGYGGGVKLHLANDSFDFEITTVNFAGCAATLGGKNVFVEAHDLSAVINSSSIGFNPVVEANKADLSELCGRERGKAELIVPLVVFLRTFSSPAYVSGREQGSEFRLCGYEDYPCRTIEEASEYRYLSSKRMIRLTSTFSFDEEVELNKESYEIDSNDKDIGIKIEATGTKTQEALVMNSVSSTLTGILFELGGSIGERSSFIHSSGGTLRFADCGMKMGNGANAVNYLFVSASGGKVEIVGMSCGGSVGEVRFVGSVIFVNGSCECLMDEVIMNQTISNGVSGLIEIATSSSATIQNCSITNCDLPSCGAIQVEKCSSIKLKNTSFENITRGKGDGGSLCVRSNDDGSQDIIRVENCSFRMCKVSEKGKGGGGLSVSLKHPSELFVSSTRFEKCCAPSTSGSEGKGGGMMLSVADADAKFELSGNLIFDQNKAEYGRNMFILANDLNTSVTNDSFKFDYSSMINNGNLFVGRDNNYSNKDLFMFLVPFSSFEIFISSEGFDVARCGSEEEPCQTMWKGMENMEKEIGKKTIQIEGSTIIQDSFNVTNYQIKKSVKMGEEDTKAILNFEKAIGSQLEYFMGNDFHFELTDIQLQLTSGFDNSAKTIISNKGGDLVITGCSFHSEAGVNNGFDCVFVDAIGGSVEVNDLSIESCNAGNSIFVIHDVGVSCHLVNVRVESLNESGGCLLQIKGPELATKINEGCEEMSLNIDNSSFSGVKRSDNGATILESKSENEICLVVNESNITEDKAETSEKGGAIFFTLESSGSMNMIDSKISNCNCSISSGKGGGVYLATDERGELNFSFVGMKFSDNGASVGKDVFIDCFNISSQINETQFQFDLRENHYSRINAIYGIDSCEHKEDTDLIEFVTIHQSDTIVVRSVDGSDERQCGTNTLPCYSIDYGLMHLTSELISQILVVEGSVIGQEINLKEMSLSSKSREMCKVEMKSEIEETRVVLITTTGTVSLLRVNFVFDSNFISQHESLISPEGGILDIMSCSFSSKLPVEGVNTEFANIPFHVINMEKGELQLDGCTMSNLILKESVLHLSSPLPSTIDSLTICNSIIETSLMDINECAQLTIKDFNTENITVEGNDESLISCLTMKKTIQLANCTIGGVSSKTAKGKLMKLEDCLDVKMDSCIFDGSSKERNEQYLNEEEEMCRWEGSLVDVVKSSVMMKVSTITNSPEGGITMRGGNVNIEKGEFLNNNPSIEGYPSLRRNIICSDSGTLNVLSLKGGDGLKDNTSLWMLNDGCSFEGIVSERDSSFFIPILENVETKEETDRMKLTFKGMLLVPCNLSYSVVKRKGEEKEIEKHDFDSNGFLSEKEVEGSVGKDLLSSCGNEIEVSVCILFGNAESPSSTEPFVVKNRSEIEQKGDERNVEGRKEGKSIWPIIVIIVCIACVILLVVIIILAVRWRRAKNENKDLREIVNDNIKKDPKAFEMVTMEMSPEEQWRRAEKEAEKKNEERIKKRVYAKSLGHSESSEHLLSESGSTEYILGRDSDKIPQWMLEKDEEEEIRKRTPSPSISSTSTTDASDTDTTFVRSECLCPTTSSMSNLVDAMACSSPHEKLIVDLRDSLFMLLHGRNEKKEMAIGNLKEREMTGVQILFWVANGALHSLEDEEDELPSLPNLSPHIVLFSEHMVICIVMHSDFLSDDDSDSSSISSSTVVTSASDDSEDSLPSSAFEDEDDYKKECLRWMAPELLMNRKMGATKKSVVFSIGMMLWECLTLQIPFGDYDAAVAGDKIVNGERPTVQSLGECSLKEAICKCWQGEPNERMSLVDLKREFVQRFPPGALIMTISDAVDYGESEDGEKESGWLTGDEPLVICERECGIVADQPDMVKKE
ncbi:putative Protein tyrosine and serine/threonine kinase [Monocercomonoides exilis]|uniref:putative Protein tyrosine and serine/threonine kinase n=1 Tax=Monocercomonoides exilis TaxID=2049356 RepID=UPI00355AB28A|nr:putative Protein tyrosine and serine/threonine kinase [Monocercomonoides exilis]|eukprot:MONOS_8178.1-p1 / transcript=MONOS_8178.1 / gene=MONOS_8178 / organism=Monocercomonoides_exilis_PA203 / gene_product=unspecified product / transcript_product=unspecified product / location=Mono_scaffold00300:54993-63035(+) / protein_length=2680 / sequence_SO=supercontig / SO=protein_coding / is_pseudo=false